MFDIIDAHVHIYPQKIAEKASKNIGEFYDIKMNFSGTIDALIEESKNFNVKKFIVHSVATTKEQVVKINDFIYQESCLHSEFIPFMTLHPNMTECEIANEILRCENRGFKGIKLHPDFQKFAIDDVAAFKIYKTASERLPILFHTGDKRYNYSNPERLAAIAKKFNKLNVIGAHFGGYSEWDKISVYKGLKNVYFDTSSSLNFISTNMAKNFIDEFGADKFFFATDYPMWSIKNELELFMKIDLTNEERELIFSKNICKFLKIEL